MPIVIPFKNFRPSARDDNIKWTQGHVQEAPPVGDEPGAFVTLSSFAIPDYPDPTDPPIINISAQGTQTPAWYRLKFTDDGGGEEFTAPLYYSTVSYRPSTREVAVHIKNRTVDNLNNFVGDFTSDTTVTADEVEELIVKGEQRVLRRLDVDPNEPIPTENIQAIKDLIALYAAMLVELTKFSEQVRTNRSPYPQLKELFDEQLAEVREDVRGIPPEGGAEVLNPPTAAYTFPEDYGGMIGWGTKF